MPQCVALNPVSALCLATLSILGCSDGEVTEPQTGSIQASLTIEG